MTSRELTLVLLSALIHAGWSVAIKGSRDPLGFNLLQEVAPVAAALGVLPWLPLGALSPAAWGFLAATGVAHGLYFYWMSCAYERGDLTLVYPIARSTPAFLPLVAVPLLGETISAVGAAGIACVVAGLWAVALGPGVSRASLRQPAAGYAALTLAATVAYSLTDKGAMAELALAPWPSPVPRAVAYSLLLALANAAVFVPLAVSRRGLAPLRAAWPERWRATGAAAASFASYALILQALTTAPVSYVVAARQTSVLFALALGVVLLRERPGRLRLLGATATFLGVALLALG